MLEQGFTSLYNPNLLVASQKISSKHGLTENFIRREKTTLTFVMYETVEK